MVNPDLLQRLKAYKLGKKLSELESANFLTRDMMRHPHKYYVRDGEGDSHVILVSTEAGRVLLEAHEREKGNEYLEKHMRKKTRKYGPSYNSAQQ